MRAGCMGRATVIALKHLLLGLGFLLTFCAFVLIAAAFLYLSLGVNKQLLEKYLSEQIQRPVQIESIETGWDGLLAEMRAQGIHVRHEDGTQSTLRLRELQVSVDPLYLLGGGFRVEKTVVHGLTLEATRNADGTIRLGDLVFADRDLTDSDTLGWLIRQGDTQIRAGQIVWRDQREVDHSFAVTEFNVETRNDDKQIRFTGRASPPHGVRQSDLLKRHDSRSVGSWWVMGRRYQRFPVATQRRQPTACATGTLTVANKRFSGREFENAVARRPNDLRPSRRRAIPVYCPAGQGRKQSTGSKVQ